MDGLRKHGSEASLADDQYDHKEDVSELEVALGYRFADPGLLVRALTHRSFSNETNFEANNQRLEFLGDAVLGLVIADAVFRKFPDSEEGGLSSRLSSLVNETALAEVASHLELGSYMRLGKGERLSGGREKPSVLADAYEAVLAALYLDGGLEVARAAIERLHAHALDECEGAAPPEDHKSRLQRLVQSEGPFRPDYAIIAERGPAHARMFVAEVAVDGDPLGQGEGRSKKEAEQQAARAALKRWEHRDKA